MHSKIQNNYVLTADYILTTKRDPQIKEIKKDICRLDSDETKLKAETIEECLDRVLMEGDEYMCWEEI